MGPVGRRGFGGSVKVADGKTSSANVPHSNVWSFDISTAEFPQQNKALVFGVNRPLDLPALDHRPQPLLSHTLMTINVTHGQDQDEDDWVCCYWRLGKTRDKGIINRLNGFKHLFKLAMKDSSQE